MRDGRRRAQAGGEEKAKEGDKRGGGETFSVGITRHKFRDRGFRAWEKEERRAGEWGREEGKIGVGGSIRCEEILIKDSGSGCWV